LFTHSDPGSAIFNGSEYNTRKRANSAPEKRSRKQAARKRAISLGDKTKYKTELCKNFDETGICEFGSRCIFAHGEQELRQVPQNPKYKTAVCRNWKNEGLCQYGKRCAFIHP
jgi:hypothetical protein